MSVFLRWWHTWLQLLPWAPASRPTAAIMHLSLPLYRSSCPSDPSSTHWALLCPWTQTRLLLSTPAQPLYPASHIQEPVPAWASSTAVLRQRSSSTAPLKYALRWSSSSNDNPIIQRQSRNTISDVYSTCTAHLKEVLLPFTTMWSWVGCFHM